MRSKLEISLSHDGDSWTASTCDARLTGKDLATIEDQLTAVIQTDPRFNKDEPIDVHISFDMEAMPRWLHQYQAHYFNYTFTANKRDL